MCDAGKAIDFPDRFRTLSDLYIRRYVYIDTYTYIQKETGEKGESGLKRGRGQGRRRAKGYIRVCTEYIFVCLRLYRRWWIIQQGEISRYTLGTLDDFFYITF